MWAGKLGFRRTERRLTGDVNLKQVPTIESGYVVLQADTLMLGGDAPKSLVDFPDGRTLYAHAYIAKSARKHGPRECATEALISAVASGLPLQLAKSRLVTLPGCELGDPDVRFMSRYFLDTNRLEVLTHGVELVGAAFNVDAETVKREIPRSEESDFYTVDLVEEVLEHVGRNEGERASLLEGLGRMLGFDAIVGANDRHPRNWGIIQSAIDPSAPFRFAPVFDTSRGLFWNFSDEQLRRRAAKEHRRPFLEKYANDSRPLIGVPGAPASNHFDLAQHILSRSVDRPLARGLRRILTAFARSRCERTLHRRFGRVLSRFRLELIRDLLAYRDDRLKQICGTGR